MKLNKKVAASIAAGAAVVATSGVAYAYFSGGSGSGSGSASTATATLNNLTTDAFVTASGTVPLDGSTAQIDIKVTNPNKYSVSWDAASVSLGTLPTGCPAGSFTVAGTGTAGSVGADTDTTVDSGFTIKFNDLGTGTGNNQDACLTSIPLVSGVS